MARATRESSKEIIANLRAEDPLALGPYLGDLATTLNVSASLVSEMIGVHEQTIFRWFFGRSTVPPQWGTKIGKVLALFVWMRDTSWPALHGTLPERKKQLAGALKTYLALARR